MPADETIEDIEWLERAAAEGWPVLMKEERVRFRQAERDVVIAHGVQAFCLSNGNLRAAAMAAQYLAVLDRIAAACLRPGPFVYTVSSAGLRLTDLT